VDLAITRDNTQIFFESDNIVVKIHGKRKEGLLISSHFDSALHARGATDAGIGISTMVSVLQALARRSCHEPLEYSVVFNFNNSEEDYLLGGSAFTRHEYFKDLRAFINLGSFILW
jgi:Zn-dependent M28 family amino/carboxypeptidase